MGIEEHLDERIKAGWKMHVPPEVEAATIEILGQRIAVLEAENAALCKQVADLQDALKPEVVDKCWICDTDLVQREDWDDHDGYPFLAIWFECKNGHYYNSSNDRESLPTSEGLDEIWSMKIRDLEDELRGAKGRAIAAEKLLESHRKVSKAAAVVAAYHPVRGNDAGFRRAHRDLIEAVESEISHWQAEQVARGGG